MTRAEFTDLLSRRDAALLANDPEAFAALFADDGVIEQPFAPVGMPARLEGRAAIRAFSAQTFPKVKIERLERRALHLTDDPEVGLVELLTQASNPASGQSFSSGSISVFRVRNGQIVSFRTYAGMIANAPA